MSTVVQVTHHHDQGTDVFFGEDVSDPGAPWVGIRMPAVSLPGRYRLLGSGIFWSPPTTIAEERIRLLGGAVRVERPHPALATEWLRARAEGWRDRSLEHPVLDPLPEWVLTTIARVPAAGRAGRLSAGRYVGGVKGEVAVLQVADDEGGLAWAAFDAPTVGGGKVDLEIEEDLDILMDGDVLGPAVKAGRLSRAGLHVQATAPPRWVRTSRRNAAEQWRLAGLDATVAFDGAAGIAIVGGRPFPVASLTEGFHRIERLLTEGPAAPPEVARG